MARTRKPNTDRRYDTTQLKRSGYERRIHRDYAAHFFRWGWATRHCRNEDVVLEVGCGQDTPFAWAVSFQQNTYPCQYVGVDLNKKPRSGVCGSWWCDTIWEFDFVERHEELRSYGPFTMAVCFEVIEHMHVKDGRRMLENVRDLCAPDAKFFLSTPVFDGHMAANHIHEYGIEELAALIEEAGWTVHRRFGTFSSWNEIKKVASPAEMKIYKRLLEWFGHDVMSTFLAPLYPDASRNNAWLLRPTP